MTQVYADPDGGTVEQATTWEIYQGAQGRWSRCKTFDDEAEARDWITRRHATCPSEDLRLVCAETTTIRSVEQELRGRP